jgi:hypothetical protein
MSSFDFIKVFSERNGERCRAEYSEGTAVARLWFRVLAGTAEGNGMVMCD